MKKKDEYEPYNILAAIVISIVVTVIVTVLLAGIVYLGVWGTL